MKSAAQSHGSIANPFSLLFAVSALLCASIAVSGQQKDTKPRTLKLQDGTIIQVLFINELSSEKNHPGDSIACEIAEDVKVDNVVVIAKGAPVVGQVSQAEKRGGWGKSGTLAFSMDYVKAVDGNNVRLRGSSAQGGKQFSPGAAIMGLSGGLKKGKPIVVAKGSVMNVYVDGSHEVVQPAPAS